MASVVLAVLSLLLAACEIVDLAAPQRSPAATIEIDMIDPGNPAVQVGVHLATGFDERGRAYSLDSAILRVNERVLAPERITGANEYEFRTIFDPTLIPNSLRLVLPRITGMWGDPPEIVLPVVRRPGPYPISLERGQDLQLALPAIALSESRNLVWQLDLAAECTPRAGQFMSITDRALPPPGLLLPASLLDHLAPDVFEACFQLFANHQVPSATYTTVIVVRQHAEYLIMRGLVTSDEKIRGFPR